MRVRARHIDTTQQQHSRLYETYQARIRRIYSRAYFKWTPEEEDNLERLAQEGRSEGEIATLMGRRPGAVRSRIAKIATRREQAIRQSRQTEPSNALAMAGPKQASVSFELRYIKPDSELYPFQVCGVFDLPVLATFGDTNILKRRSLALFCSNRVPAELIPDVYGLASALYSTGATVIGGFHTPIEKECLRMLLKAGGTVIACLPRSIEGMRVPPQWHDALNEGRLLVTSPFAGNRRDVSAAMAAQRNRLVAAIAEAIVVAHASPGGKTEQVCREVLTWGKQVYTLRSPYNAHILELGATALDLEAVSTMLMSAQLTAR